jgi:hypothetical protein
MSSSTEQAMLEELRQIKTLLTPKAPEEKKLGRAEIRRTVAVALGAAFGFVIALVWNNVVQSGLAVAGISITAAKTITDLFTTIGVAVLITIIMVVLIIVIGRWGSKP